MYWLKRNTSIVGIALAGLLLLLVFMIWIPVSEANAYERTSESASAVSATVQATPTEDATMTALKKEQLTQQVKQLDNWWLYWLYNGSTAFIAAITAIVVASIGFYQWRGNQNAERKKEVAAQDKELRDRAEERFKTAVAALGDGKEGTQVGGAILLRSFLNKDDEEIYGRYYTQIFDLAVAYLSISNLSRPSEDPDGLPPSPVDATTPLPLTPLRKALIVVFKESFPLARKKLDKIVSGFDTLALDASHIRLDRAFLAVSDLRHIWMRGASLSKAILVNADLSKAALINADLKGAKLSYANLKGVHLDGANLSRVDLRDADLTEADLTKANLEKADLSGANLTGAYLEETRSLKDTDLRRVKGLSKEQLQACKEKGAIIDEDDNSTAF
jgi:uncharacterized protein YjbI with pentapeptide repeats